MRDERGHGHGSIIAGPARVITFGQAHRRFRFDLRYRTLLGGSRPRLLEELRALAAEGGITPASGLADWLEALAMEPADFYGIRGAGFTALRRELGWLTAAPHPEEHRLTRAIGSGLLHGDEPDRLRATAAALAAPVPPDPEALGERERRQ